MTFTALGLHDQLIEGVVAAGMTEPTTIQSLAIPPALEGKDVFGRAQGSAGKIEAYIFPLLEFLSRSAGKGEEWVPPLALILSPTRKSVQEIQAATLRYGKYLSIRVVGVFGGTDIDKQTRLLKRRTEVVVATPGRLVDHIGRGTVDLSHIGFLAIDEVDKMAELGLTADLTTIVNALPSTRQSMLFSGVLTTEITSLAGTILREPVTVDAGEATVSAPSVHERVVATRREARMRTLLHLLESEAMQRVVILSQKEYEAERILRALKGKGIASRAIRSDWSGDEKTLAVNELRDGAVRAFVGTTEASRALAGEVIAHVIHFDFPQQHGHDRSHRTSRPNGGISGADTVSFVLDRDRMPPQRSDRLQGRTIQPATHGRETNRSTQRRSGVSNNHEGRRVMAEHTVKQFEKPTKATKRRKKSTIVFARRKKPLKKLETFSSDHSGAGW